MVVTWASLLRNVIFHHLLSLLLTFVHLPNTNTKYLIDETWELHNWNFHMD